MNHRAFAKETDFYQFRASSSWQQTYICLESDLPWVGVTIRPLEQVVSTKKGKANCYLTQALRKCLKYWCPQ